MFDRDVSTRALMDVWADNMLDATYETFVAAGDVENFDAATEAAAATLADMRERFVTDAARLGVANVEQLADAYGLIPGNVREVLHVVCSLT